MQGARKGRFTPRTTDSRHACAVAPNLLDWRFSVDADVNAWAGDITYIPTCDGWLYLAIVSALRTRQILGYSLANHMRADLVEQVFHSAFLLLQWYKVTLDHSGRGSLYASAKFVQAIAPLGFVPRMSRKGNCWDNAAPESLFAKHRFERQSDKAFVRMLGGEPSVLTGTAIELLQKATIVRRQSNADRHFQLLQRALVSRRHCLEKKVSRTSCGMPCG